MRLSLISLLMIPLAVGCGDGDEESAATPDERIEGTEAGDCSDGSDNDLDGIFDCDEAECSGSPDCEEADADADADADDTGEPAGTDEDGDGVTLEDGDCDDTDATIYPGAPEVWDDGIDQDCDGVADVEGSSCSADLTVTFPDGSTTALDGCADWDFDATFEYDPDDPPEVTSFTFTLGATTEADFDCRIELVQEGVCGPGYYDERDDSTTTTAVLMDCSGVADEYESTFSSHEGYLRIDTIEAGTDAGSFAGDPLPTTLEGHLHVWTPEGIDVRGDMSLTLVQLAGDSEEAPDCSTVNPDADGDGFLDQNFDGEDCDDTSSVLLGIGDCDGDGVATADDCDDASPVLLGIGDCDGDGVATADDCDDASPVLLGIGDCDGDGAATEDDCDDADSARFPLAFDVLDDDIDQDCDGGDDVTCTGDFFVGEDAETAMGDLEYCAVITGSLSIDYLYPRTHVDELANLTQVGSNLTIEGNSLTNIDGLRNLVEVGLNLSIRWNDLTNVDGLESLAEVGGDLDISSNLTNIDGLANLTEVGGDLRLLNLESLTNVDGLESLTEVGGTLKLYDNFALTNIDGLASLTTVGADLILKYSYEITDIDGLSSLTEVGGILRIANNNSLINIDGLESLTAAGGLFIWGNATLCQSLVDAFVAGLEALGWASDTSFEDNADC